MTCEPHVRRELEEELADETADARRELIEVDLEFGGPRSRVISQYPPPPPVIDPDTATITGQAR